MPIARILVVDDDRWLRQMVRDFLEVADFTVGAAVDGADGVAQAVALQPDLILRDPMMPHADGYTACQRLKANPVTQAIPVIFLTASADLSLNRRASALGAVACLTKPFRRAAPVAAVHTTLHGVARRGNRSGAEGSGSRTSNGTRTSP